MWRERWVVSWWGLRSVRRAACSLGETESLGLSGLQIETQPPLEGSRQTPRALAQQWCLRVPIPLELASRLKKPQALHEKEVVGPWAKSYKLLILNFYAKDSVNRVKQQPTEWKNVFVNHISDMGLISRIYQELLQINNIRQGSQLEMGKGLGTDSSPKKNTNGRWAHENLDSQHY